MMTAKEAIESAKVYVGGTSADDSEMLLHLNRAAGEVSTRSRSITTSFRRSLYENQYQYALPDDTLQTWEIRYRRRQDHWPQLTRTRLDKAIDYALTYKNSFSSHPCSYDIWGKANLEKVIRQEVTESTEDPDNPITSSEYRATIDGNFNFVRKGDTIINLSDGDSRSKILNSSVEGGDRVHTDLEFEPLEGGEREHLNVGDEVRIISPHRYNKVLIISPPPKKTDDAGVESLSIFLSLKHRTITLEDLENDNDSLEIDIDLEEAFRFLMEHYVEAAVNGQTSDTALLLYEKYNSKYKESMPRVRRQVKEAMNTWRDGLGAPYMDGYFETSTSNPHRDSAYKII